MALGANVKLVPESIVYGETLEDDIITVDYNLPIAKRAAQTPKIGEAYPGDRYVAAQTAPWGYTVLETGSMTSRRSPDQGAYITGVKYAKPKIPFTSGIEGLKEVYRKPETGRRGRYMGTRVFLAVDSTAEAIAESSLAEGTPMVASSNWQYALLREKYIERNWRVGLARITAHYDSRAELGEVIYVNKGILEYESSAVMQWNRDPVPDTDPKRRIDEIYYDDVAKCRKQWVRVKGNNLWPLITANLRIHAVLTASKLAEIEVLVGLVNSVNCPNLGAAGTLWFNKFWMRQRPRGQSTLIDCIIYLARDRAGWNTRTLAQLQKYLIVQEQLLKQDGVTPVEGQLLPTGSWVKVSAATTEMPMPEPPKPFAAIDGLLT